MGDLMDTDMTRYGEKYYVEIAGNANAAAKWLIWNSITSDSAAKEARTPSRT